MKRCSKCKITKNISEFYKQRSHKDGYHSELKKSREVYKKIKKIVYDYYGWKCNCCGETGRTFLTIDHVNNDGKKDVSDSGNRIIGYKLYKKIIKMNFPNIYQVLCWNCNWSKRFNNGVCEHHIKHD